MPDHEPTSTSGLVEPTLRAFVTTRLDTGTSPYYLRHLLSSEIERLSLTVESQDPYDLAAFHIDQAAAVLEQAQNDSEVSESKSGDVLAEVDRLVGQAKQQA